MVGVSFSVLSGLSCSYTKDGGETLIFVARNEDGTPTCGLVEDGIKTVTRRLKPLPVSKVFAVQPGRGMFAVCHVRVVSCMNSLEHFKLYKKNICSYMESEAYKEGFVSWRGLMGFFGENKISFNDTFRIEFELVDNGI